MDHSPDPASPSGPAGNPKALDPPLEEREQLQRRHPQALEWFYSTYFDRIYGYVRRLLREDHLAEDVTQDIFMHIHRSLPSYDPQREFRPWVFTIATNKVRDFWRSRRHKDASREVGVDDEDGSFAVSASPGPVQELEAGEVGAMVGQAIEALPSGLRQTLMLRYFEQLSFAEIGEIIDRNETAVRKRYSRALAELRKRLSGVLGADPAATDPSEVGGSLEP